MTLKIKISDALLVLIAFAFISYLVMRAFILPITIDEAYSILQYVPKTCWEILTYDYQEPSANNHILNTLSIKLLTQIFGVNLLSARLGNLLAGALFAVTGIWLVRQFFTNSWARMAALILWLGNVYMCEFFSIGRGYGMSIGLMSLAICFTVKYFQHEDFKYLVAALIAAMLMVAASFTLLSFYICLSGILLLKLWPPNNDWLKKISVFMVAHLLLFLLLFLPVTRMLAFKEFDKFGVNGFYQDTVSDFLRTYLKGAKLPGEHSLQIIAWVLTAWVVMAAMVACYKWWREKTPSWPTALLILMPGTVAIYISMTVFTDAAWLPARSCQFFYPLLVLTYFCIGKWLVNVLGKWLKPPLILGSLASITWFTSVANLEYSREWWFDRDTVAILNYLKNQHQQEERQTPIKFNSHWMYSLSFKFHLLDNMTDFEKYVDADMSWRDLPLPTDNFEYFYCEAKDYTKLADRYDIAWVLEPGQRLLLKRKK